MKKIIVVLALASVAIGCQKIAAGGNKGVLKMEEGAEHYSDDVISDEATDKYYETYGKKVQKTADSVKTPVVTPAPEAVEVSVQPEVTEENVAK